MQGTLHKKCEGDLFSFRMISTKTIHFSNQFRINHVTVNIVYIRIKNVYNATWDTILHKITNIVYHRFSNYIKISYITETFKMIP